MDNQAVQKIRELIAKNENIGIAVGKDPRIDEMGAGLALYLSLGNSGKSVNIACPTEPTVEISSLVGIDKVKNTLDSGKGDLIVSFPDRGDIKKISYTREDGMLNIIVKAADEGLTFDEREIKFRKGGEAAALLFIVGAPRLSDLGNLFDAESLKDTTTVNIDNKPENQGYGDIVLASNNFSSVSENVSSLVVALDLKMDIDVAQNLLFGISTATDNFQNPNTSPLAFEMAALLLKKGARRTSLKETKKDTQDLQDFSSLFIPGKTRSQTAPKPSQSWPRTVQTESREEEKKRDENPPDDWLAPKIYKGSTAI